MSNAIALFGSPAHLYHFFVKLFWMQGSVARRTDIACLGRSGAWLGSASAFAKAEYERLLLSLVVRYYCGEQFHLWLLHLKGL